MTENGRRCLQILVDLEERFPDPQGFTAEDITVQYDDLPKRAKPVMTISSFLTHLKRLGYVTRKPSSDKTIAWWSSTELGRRALKGR
jgi:hypothetical protein